MAYVGKNTVGPVTYTLTANYKDASRYQASSSFTAKLMAGYFETGFGIGEKARLGIYADSAGEPAALLGYTDEITGDGNAGWKFASLTSAVSISSGSFYWLAFIVDTNCNCKSTVAGSAANNIDAYADGFSNPFGVHNDATNEHSIYATDAFTPGDLSTGGAVVETSGGTKYAILLDDSGNLDIWKNIDGTSSQADTDTPTTVHGGGNIAWVHAAIDSADDIHIICACDADQTRDIAYAVFDCGTDTIGAWSEAAAYTQVVSNPGCQISIDSNDDPRVLFVDNVKVGGSSQDNIYYTHDVGAGWIAAEQVGARAVKTDAYNSPRVTVCAADDVEAFYYFSTAGDPAYRRRNGTWNSESVYTETSATVGAVTITTGDTVYRYHVDADDDIEENDVDTGYNSDATYERVSAALANSDRYVFYIDTSDDVHVISNDGGGWTDESAQQTGTYLYVIAEWAYNNENQSGEINYIFSDSTNVYYDAFSLAPPPTGQPVQIRTKGIPTGSGYRPWN